MKKENEIAVTFDVDASEDFLHTIFVNGESVKNLALTFQGDENKEDREISEGLCNTIFTKIQNKHDGISPDLVNKYLIEHADTISLRDRVVAALQIEQHAASNNPVAELAIATKAMRADTLTDAVQDFHNDKEIFVKEGIQTEQEVEYATLNLAGSIVHVISETHRPQDPMKQIMKLFEGLLGGNDDQ